jgi:hypothetical protein
MVDTRGPREKTYHIGRKDQAMKIDNMHVSHQWRLIVESTWLTMRQQGGSGSMRRCRRHRYRLLSNDFMQPRVPYIKISHKDFTIPPPYQNHTTSTMTSTTSSNKKSSSNKKGRLNPQQRERERKKAKEAALREAKAKLAAIQEEARLLQSKGLILW